MKGHTAWDVKEVTEGQEYMKRLKQTIEKDNNYIERNINKGENQTQFPMITDSNEQAGLLISFATSVQGRNHFKENYVRHVRLKTIFMLVLEEAKLLIDLIEKELDK